MSNQHWISEIIQLNHNIKSFWQVISLRYYQFFLKDFYVYIYDKYFFFFLSLSYGLLASGISVVPYWYLNLQSAPSSYLPKEFVKYWEYLFLTIISNMYWPGRLSETELFGVIYSVFFPFSF